MSFTDRQRQAILAESHLLMEAGAGSGKTTTLVGKIMHALGAEVLPGERAARPCELDGIVAITFTEAAASDLRAALRREVRAEAKATGDPVWRRRLYSLERARIGTIHSFCGALLREWGERVGIDPGFRVLDEMQATLLRREVAQGVLFDALGSGDAEVTGLVAALGMGGARGVVETAMGEPTLARASLARWCPNGTPAVGEMRGLVEAAGLVWRDHDEQCLGYAGALLRLAVAARERMEQRLAEEGALDFEGLIEGAHRLLHEGEDVLRRLRGRVRWLFMDEFQDTDRTQKEIAYRICGLDGPAEGKAPRLCVVGDPKQSIYRFRRADVSVWNAVADDFAARGLPVIPLDTNFRSRAPLLGYVNATFSRLMDGVPEEGGDARHEVRYASLLAARDLEGDSGLLEILAVEGRREDGKKINADARRRAESEMVARRIRQMVAGERCVHERDTEGVDQFRAPRWKDVALLFRSRTALSYYEEALRRHDIPYYVAAGSGFFTRREVLDLGMLFTALADPRDDVAWAGVLRSPWVGLADESLLLLRRLVGSAPLSQGLTRELAGGEGERLRRAAEWLRELKFLRDRVRPAVLVERALERSGYAEHLLVQEGGELALANLRKLVRMAEGSGAASLGELVEWLRERSEVGSREPEARLHTAGEDVVVLTTVHASKGLEWPVVFLCDMERDLVSSNQRPSLFFDEEAGIGLRLKDRDDADEPQTGAWERLAARDRALDVAEERRIWYVAATRARDRLVLAGCVLEEASAAVDPVKGPQRVAQWMLSALEVTEEEAVYGDGARRWRARVIREIDVDAPGRASIAPPTAADLDDAPPLTGRAALGLGALPPIRPRRQHSATELMTFARNREEHRRTYGLGLPPRRFGGAGDASGEPDGPDSAAAELDAREVGNIVHGVLEKLREDSDLAALLDAEISAELGEGAAAALSAETRRHLRILLEETRAHPTLARLYDGGRTESELPFTWLLDHDGTPVALRGAMDLVGFVDGAPEIIDFKTHAIRPGEEKEVGRRYAIQRHAYIAALTDLLGTAPGAMRFFFPETQDSSSSELDDAAIAEARERIRAILLQVAGS